jgi:hypothetical protein
MFYVGQKVTPIEEWQPDDTGDIDPQLGVVYTIRHIEEGQGRDGPLVGLLLVEIHNKPRLLKTLNGNRVTERMFAAEFFRPVVDISDLEAIVREQMLGKPRKIAPDKFDKQRIHSALPQAVAGAMPAGASVAPRADAPPIPDALSSSRMMRETPAGGI